MSRLFAIITTLLVIIFVASAAFGVFYNGNAKGANMPVDIKYEIKSTKNIWPDDFYSFTYPTVGDRSFQLDSYWTFEYSKYPFGGPVWVFHPYALDMTDIDFSVIQLPR
jgi:hypothetical protein